MDEDQQPLLDSEERIISNIGITAIKIKAAIRSLVIITLIYIISIFVWWIGLNTYGFTYEALEVTDPLVKSGHRISGKLAWSIVQDICVNPHPYNSQENLLVYQKLMDRLEGLQRQFRNLSCPYQASFDISDPDSVNMTTHHLSHQVYYESNNIVARVRGKSNKSFLVSAHYDSVSTSYGVTDDGIAVGSIIAVMEAILAYSCHEQLEYSIIFLINNGEEIGLLGGTSFLLHPWFQHVKGFMNLGFVEIVHER